MTYGASDGRVPGLVGYEVADVAIVPVQAASAAPIDSVDALLAQPLIHVLGPFQGWTRWQARFCPERALPDFALETDSYHAAMLAVERGEGVCLGVLPQLRPWLRAGRVRALDAFALPVAEQSALAVVAPHQAGRAAVETFVDWLRGELA